MTTARASPMPANTGLCVVASSYVSISKISTMSSFRRLIDKIHSVFRIYLAGLRHVMQTYVKESVENTVKMSTVKIHNRSQLSAFMKPGLKKLQIVHRSYNWTTHICFVIGWPLCVLVFLYYCRKHYYCILARNSSFSKIVLNNV